MAWDLFGRSLNLTKVIMDIIEQKRSEDVMEEFRKNGRDVDIKEQEVNILPKFKNSVYKLRNNVAKPKLECKFCKNNGEDVKFYSSHSLRDSVGNTVCPILLKHKCTVCHSNGHTLSYCPRNGPLPQVAPMNILKSTKMANGKWRRPLK